MNKELEKQLKPFTVRFSKEDWLFVKQQAAIQEKSMQDVIKKSINLYKKILENRLTDS